jgi:cytochrome c-type biogenesis protein CcmE
MVKENIAIAIIVIVLFVVLAIVGFAIYAVQNHVSFFWNRRAIDEEEGE